MSERSSAGVIAYSLVVVLPPGTVGPQHPGSLRHLIAVRGDEPPVPKAPQVLGGEKGEGPGVPQGAHLFALVGGPEGLGAVLQHLEAVGAGDLQDGVHLGGQAVEVDGEDGLGPRGDGGGY